MNQRMQRSTCLVAACLITMCATDAAAQSADSTERSAPPIYYALIHSPGEKWVDSLRSFDQPGINEHVAYMSVLADSGRIVVGGPFLNAAGGLMIYKGESLEEAIEAAEQDPAVKSGLLVVTVRKWLTALGLSIESQ